MSSLKPHDVVFIKQAYDEVIGPGASKKTQSQPQQQKSQQYRYGDGIGKLTSGLFGSWLK